MTGKVSVFRDRKAIEDEARRWLVRLDGDVPLAANEIQALREWTAQSPAHREELLRLAKFWNQANVLSQLAIPLRTPGRMKGAKLFGAVFSAPGAAITAAVLLGIAAVLAAVLLQQPITATNGTYATELGGHQVQTLVDGSVLELNTASEVRVEYDENARIVRLLRGEAHFDVAHDSSRPFEVHAGEGRVRAVGTAFSVYLRDDEVRVTVSEGRVELAAVKTVVQEKAGTADAQRAVAEASAGARKNEPALVLRSLSSGQSATFSHEIDEVRTLSEEDIGRHLAWREGMLVFTGDPLSEVIAEVSRYTPVNIEIGDPELGALPVGGRFKVGDIDAIFDVLGSSFGIQVVRVDELHIRLLARAEI